ncbi:MAG: ABC transporter permease [Actinomycetota bacterium]|nr:ABC transporter permease [Actinomycetota bacterium]
MSIQTAVLTARRSITVERRHVLAGLLVFLGLIDALVFGYLASKGDAVFTFTLTGAKVNVPNLVLAPGPVDEGLGALSVLLGIVYATFDLARVPRRLIAATCLVGFVVSFLVWSDAGRIPLPFVSLLATTMSSSIPLMLGALAGCLCERSGVINVAIEGQLLLGAFGAAVVASAFGNLWLGLITGALCGGLIALLLGAFAIRYRVDQIVLGIVLNVFASGLTGYLYDAALVPYENRLNSPQTFNPIKIPLLGDIPILGPVLFDSTVFLYITYIVIALVQVGLFSTRWGLRVRAVGEHPEAADTVGINVLATRWRNVILGGLVAGIGGAYLTIGSVGSFGKDMSSGQGFIALAAMIFGRWTPLGAVGAALLFGFTTAVANVLGTLGAPIPSDILLMLPYVATIVAVAGLVGRGRPPKADGQPYVKA